MPHQNTPMNILRGFTHYIWGDDTTTNYTVNHWSKGLKHWAYYVHARGSYPFNILHKDGYHSNMPSSYIFSVRTYVKICWAQLFLRYVGSKPGVLLSVLAKGCHEGPLVGMKMIVLTHWPLEFEWNFWSNFQANFNDWWLWHLLWNWPQMNASGPCWW